MAVTPRLRRLRNRNSFSSATDDERRVAAVEASPGFATIVVM
jgi:hypothetical protein